MKPQSLPLIVVICVGILFLAACQPVTPTEDVGGILEFDQFIGLVQYGEYRVLLPHSPLGGNTRLTTIPIMASQPPESGEINLSDYEGKIILVYGHGDGDWIYWASVEDQPALIFPAVMRQLHAQLGEPE